MPEWIYFIHPPRDNFAETMSPIEREVWSTHFQRLQRLLSDGTLILAGPTLGPINTGVAIFHAPDEEAARWQSRRGFAVACPDWRRSQ